jgi:hypothetical protein
MYSLYVWLARGLALAVLIQVFLAGLALFQDAGRWAGHVHFGRVIAVLPALMLAASVIARMPVSFRLSGAGLVGAALLMFVTANLPAGAGVLSALHPVLALLMFMGAVANARKASALVKASRPESNVHAVRGNAG